MRELHRHLERIDSVVLLILSFTYFTVSCIYYAHCAFLVRHSQLAILLVLFSFRAPCESLLSAPTICMSAASDLKAEIQRLLAFCDNLSQIKAR